MSQMSERTENAPPVWRLEVSERSEPNEANAEANAEVSRSKRQKDVFVSKEMVLKECGLVSKYKSMATGIIPLQKSCN